MANLTVNSMTSEQAQAADSVLVRRSYSQPKLTPYGDVRDLTEAGAGSLSEGVAMVAMMRFP